jgi:hypothetical protein
MAALCFLIALLLGGAAFLFKQAAGEISVGTQWASDVCSMSPMFCHHPEYLAYAAGVALVIAIGASWVALRTEAVASAATAVIPRESGVSSTPRPLDSSINVSGILDHPLTRVMTVRICVRFKFQTAHSVIASEAKQSISPSKESMDCFVASLLAMTSDTPSRSRGAIRPSYALHVPPSLQRAQGIPGARCARRHVCNG